MPVQVLDYGVNNLRSVVNAFEFLGIEVSVTTRVPSEGRLVIPGVGAFGAAMEALTPLKRDIQRFANDGGRVLGICLGQQLLFNESEEFGSHTGLELIPGRVRYLKAPGLKVPHVGWNDVTAVDGTQYGQMYFVHSLVTICEDESDIHAQTTYGESFPSMVRRGNIWGCQFHPEKSSEAGLRLLREFAA